VKGKNATNAVTAKPKGWGVRKRLWQSPPWGQGKKEPNVVVPFGQTSYKSKQNHSNLFWYAGLCACKVTVKDKTFTEAGMLPFDRLRALFSMTRLWALCHSG